MSSKSTADVLREVRIKTFAFFSLVGIQTCIGITYKLATLGQSGFKFSTTSACTMSEFAKFTLAFLLLFGDYRRRSSEDFVHEALRSIQTQLDGISVFHILTLSLLYTINNQFTFYIIIKADPGSVFLFKAGSTMIVALTQRILLARKLHRLQWSALFLQFAGIIVVQYNPVSRKPLLPIPTYCCMLVSVFITALTTVRNEYLVKNFKIDLNVQNIVLYAGGAVMNLFAFFCIPNPNDAHGNIGLFDGYDSWAAKGVVLSNALIGIAITLVYKYADALVKMIATDCTTMILMVFSTTVLGTPSTPLTWFGVMIVFVAIQQYGDAGKLHAEKHAMQKELEAAQKAVAEAKAQDLESNGLTDGLEEAEEDDAPLLEKSNKVSPISNGGPNAAKYGQSIDEDDEV